MNTRTSSNALAWILCALLLAALGVAGWMAWSEARTATGANPAADPAKQAALDQLTKDNSELASLLAALRTLLEADPCSIPGDFQGLSLLPEGSAPAAPPPPTGQTPPPHTPAMPVAPSESQSPPVQPETVAPEAGSNVSTSLAAGNFAASTEAIEAATVLVLSSQGTGTGFFVAPGIVVTNHHVTEDDRSVLVINKRLGRIPATVLAVSDYKNQERDYAILRVQGADLPDPLPLCGDVKRTDKVSTWGYPASIGRIDPQFVALARGDLDAIPEEVYSEGVVNVVYDTMPPMILHTAVTSHGNSGGPLVNADGCVVGINTMIQRDDLSYRQTSVALAGNDLNLFLRQAGITPLFRPAREEVRP